MSEAALSERVTLGQIFWVFARIGATSFGGGVVAYLQHSLVEKEKWLTADVLLHFRPFPTRSNEGQMKVK